jgi:hypothetical protein
MIGCVKKSKKWFAIFPALLNIISLLFYQSASVVHYGNNNTLTSREENRSEYFLAPSAVPPGSSRWELIFTIEGCMLYDIDTPGVLGYSPDVQEALQLDGMDFLGVPPYIHSLYYDASTPIMTRSRISVMLGGVNLEFGTTDLTKNWVWIIGTLRSGSISNYDGFSLWVKVVKAVMNETKRLRESSSNGWSQEAIQVVGIVEVWLSESRIEKLYGELCPYLDIEFNILVYKFQCWVAEILKPAKGKDGLATDVKPIREEIDAIIGDLEDFYKLLREGDISFWGCKAMDLARKVNDRLSKSNSFVIAVDCDRYEQFKSLKNRLLEWINGTNMSYNNNLDYCNEKLGILDDKLQKWNRTRGTSLIAHEDEIGHSCPEFSGLEHSIDELRGGVKGWRVDYSRGCEILIEIGSKLGMFNGGKIRSMIDKYDDGRKVRSVIDECDDGGKTRIGIGECGTSGSIGEQVDSARAVLWNSFTNETFDYDDYEPGTETRFMDKKFLSNVNRMKMKEPVILLTRLSELFNYYIFTNISLADNIQ